MVSETASAAEAMRVVDHPGSKLPVRSTSIDASLAGDERVILAPGQDLFTRLEDLLATRDLPGAFFNILSGSVVDLTLMTGGPGSDRPISFHGPLDFAAPLAVVAGSGIVGVDEDGKRSTHCHAVFRNSGGDLVGGHLIKGRTIAGPEGLEVQVLLLGGARFARRADPETQFVIFHPEAA